MAEASKTIEMQVTRDNLWKVITDYEKYGEFVEGVQNVKILSRTKNEVRIQYGIELLGKEIFYVLDHFEDIPDTMSWKLVESNILKANSGSWIIKDLGGGRSEVTYQLALDFKIYVPGIVLNGLVKSSLPKMLGSFEKRTKEVFANG
ncbi:MAG: SRPBCC family protein [Bdellovibrionota bacterium]